MTDQAGGHEHYAILLRDSVLASCNLVLILSEGFNTLGDAIPL